MDRNEKRKAEREAAHIIKNAKKDMIRWVEVLGYVPTEEQAKAWQEGYLAGINRVKTEQED